jgi:penicillin-binding protein 2
MLVGLGVLIWIVLLGRLFQMQLLEGDRLSRRAKRNFVSSVDVEASRGRIFDRERRLLATNRPAYSLWVTALVRQPSANENARVAEKRKPVSDEEIEALAGLLDFADDADRDAFLAKIRSLRDDRQAGRYAQRVRNNLTREEMSRIVTRDEFTHFADIRESARRYYPAGEATAFITGRMSSISPEVLEMQPNYRPDDRIGITGIERERENYLRGRLGSRALVVDPKGREVKNPPETALESLPLPVPPIPGQDIYLTIDLELQRAAMDAFLGRPAGGLVAMDVHTGEVLAMVSVPAVDPNLWERPISQVQWKEWVESPLQPLIDKTVQQHFFPGSTYKVVSALALLQDPSFDPNDTIECNGYYEYGGQRFRDTHRHGDRVDLRMAITGSCNVFFYQMAAERGLTLSRMEKAARLLGLGEATGLGINSEVRGVVPTAELELRQGTFQGGVKLNSAIGQGNVKVTILQLAVVYAAIANGGHVLTPVLVDRIETFDGRLVIKSKDQAKGEPVMTPEQRRVIHDGLVGVVNNEAGTAFSERLENVVVAGKTGTAQVGTRTISEAEAKIPDWDPTRAHAWFAAYAPADNPEIAVAALVEHGGVGADAAAPIAMTVIRRYLNMKQTHLDARRADGGEPPLPGSKGPEKQTTIGGRP